MAEIIDLALFHRTQQATGPAAIRALLAFELAAGVTVHAAAWAFAMPEAEYAASDIDIDAMAKLLFEAGLHYFGGNDDQPAALVLADERKFQARFKHLGCREACMIALGKGILIKHRVDWSL